MAGTITIEVFKEKKAEELTSALASPDCRAGAGSAAAYTAALACALCLRAARICQARNEADERLGYIVRNSEILRGYMVNLIDEDVKSKGPYRRALKQGGAREREATLQTAACIDAEIVNMMEPCLKFLEELAPLCPADDRHFIAEAAELALCACRVAQSVIFSYSEQSEDEIYRFVTRRENEVFLAERRALYESVLAKLAE